MAPPRVSITPLTMSSSAGSAGAFASLSQNVVRKVSRLREYRLDEATGIRAGQLRWPRMVTPFGVTMTSPGTVAAQLPPASAARSMITLPGRMLSTIGCVTITGACRPITRAVQITMSFLATVVAIRSACFWRNASLISRA